jgi:SAM-dependent methyltransferase
MHQSALDKMKVFVEKYLSKYENEPLSILDIGSQSVASQVNHRFLFDKPKWVYKGLDIESGENVDVVVKDPYDWAEVETDSFDVVISNQAFEHIPYFWVTAFEIGRVLRDGGIACIIAPSSGGEHRYPLDTYRYYPDGFSAICDYIGFKKLEVYRQDVDLQYPDGSDPLKDSCLVMQKPLFNDGERENFIVKNKLHKLLLNDLNIDFIKNLKKTKLEFESPGINKKSCLYLVTPKNAFKDLEVERLSKIPNSFIRKRAIKTCIPILINNIFGRRFAKYIFKIYPKMELWS